MMYPLQPWCLLFMHFLELISMSLIQLHVIPMLDSLIFFLYVTASKLDVKFKAPLAIDFNSRLTLDQHLKLLLMSMAHYNNSCKDVSPGFSNCIVMSHCIKYLVVFKYVFSA